MNWIFKFSILWFLFISSCAIPQQRVIVSDQGVLTDPGIVYGVLSNGFQYILKQNAKPDDQVNIHLNVFAGSMHETDDQQGIAHYLEHLLFNGSEHFKPGELIEYFQSIGMDFGADANASTSFFNTIYDLSLPKADQKHLDKAFVVIQDYAKGALLLESEVKREQGIILAEKRERDSVSYRTLKKTLAFELPGSIFNKRFPIGIDTVIKNADQKLLKAYYDRWYRPDNMALIVVGDFDVKMVQSMITQRFSKLKPRSSFKKPVLTTRWKEHKGIKAFYHYEKESGSTQITIETMSWIPFETQTLDKLKKNILTRIANAMLLNRLTRMISKQMVDFTEADVFSGAFLRHISMSSISATCEPDKWENGLTQLEKALRQALLYGFTSKELVRVKADFISSLENQVNQASSQKSSQVSKSILQSINAKKLLLSPQQKEDILKPFIESITLEDTRQALKNAWSKDHRLILVTGNAQINTQDPEFTILNAYQNNKMKRVDKFKGFESGNFPYLKLPSLKFGIRSKIENIKDFGITSIEFDNNVQLKLKKTNFKKNEFLFKAIFGDGKKSEPISKPGLSLLSEEVLQTSGLGNLDSDQLEEALAGNKVSFKFEIHDNYFSISGSSDPKEAELIFQLIYHYLNDPGYRVEALDLSKTFYKQQYESFMRTPEGILQIKGDLFLAKNDTRFGLAHPDTINHYALNDIKNWMSPYFQNSPIEVSIVGDFDEKNIINLASKYMGAFKKRKNFPNKFISTGKITFPKGEQLDLKLNTKINQGVVRLAFLTDDFWNIRQTRQMHVLARVFSERLRIVIREELGETYSTYAYNDPSMIYKNYGVLHVVAKVKPENQKRVHDKMLEIVDSILLDGISQKETDLALRPLLKHIKVMRGTNRYWLNSVMANASTYPEKFGWAKTIIQDYEKITPNDLIRLAKKYLKIHESALIVIKP